MQSPDGVQNAEQTIGTAFHGEAPPELHTHCHAAIQHASPLLPSPSVCIPVAVLYTCACTPAIFIPCHA